MPVTPRGRRLLLWTAGVAGVLLPGVSGVLGGLPALLGSLLGMGLVGAFFLSGRFPVRLADRVPKGVAFIVLGANYGFRVVLLFVALVALRGADWLDSRFVGVAVVLGALVWSAVQIGLHVTSRRPTIEPFGARR
jgi:ATP synthase protein I